MLEQIMHKYSKTVQTWSQHSAKMGAETSKKSVAKSIKNQASILVKPEHQNWVPGAARAAEWSPVPDAYRPKTGKPEGPVGPIY